jgi:hypothetical protein
MRFDFAHPTHPGKSTLMAWSEGELSWWRGWLVRRHVRSCWQCKGQIGELESIICAVSTHIDQIPDPSRVDTTKAYWRFREACLELDAPPLKRRLSLKPAWVIAAVVVLATAGLAYVTTWPIFFKDVPKPPASIPRQVRNQPPPVVSPYKPVESVRDGVKLEGSLPPMQLHLEQPQALPPWQPKADPIAIEINALATLHRSRFCLNTGISVRTVGSLVEISGIVSSQDQRDRIKGILEGIGPAGALRIRLDDPAAATDAAPAAVTTQTESSSNGNRITPPIVTWLRQSPGAASRLTEREMFNLMTSVILGAESASSDSWAIRHLAEQFPLSRTRHLRPELSDQLLQMVDDHTIALANSMQKLQGRLDLVLENRPALGGVSLASIPDAPWQNKVLALQRRVEDVVRQLLGSFSTDAGSRPPVDSAAKVDFSELLQSMNSQIRTSMSLAGDLRSDRQKTSASDRSVQDQNRER